MVVLLVLDSVEWLLNHQIVLHWKSVNRRFETEWKRKTTTMNRNVGCLTILLDFGVDVTEFHTSTHPITHCLVKDLQENIFNKTDSWNGKRMMFVKRFVPYMGMGAPNMGRMLLNMERTWPNMEVVHHSGCCRCCCCCCVYALLCSSSSLAQHQEEISEPSGLQWNHSLNQYENLWMQYVRWLLKLSRIIRRHLSFLYVHGCRRQWPPYGDARAMSLVCIVLPRCSWLSSTISSIWWCRWYLFCCAETFLLPIMLLA